MRVSNWLTVHPALLYSAPAMTRRALIMGIVAAIVFSAAGRYITAYTPTPAIVRGHLPIGVFGLLICFAIVVNPVLGRIRSTWRLRGSELALIMALMLGAATVVDAGLMRCFLNVCVYPMHAERTTPGWRKEHVLENMPHVMLANDGKYNEEVVDKYIGQGDPIAWPKPWYVPWKWANKEKLGEFRNTLGESWRRIPWAAWYKPLLFWGSLTALSYAAVMGLSVLVHRQWARKERIRYPLAEIVSSILVQDERGRTVMFGCKPFWVGFTVAMSVAMVNLVALWYPNSVNIPLNIDASSLNEAFPEFMKTAGASYFAAFRLYPAAIGIAFLLASDIGFGLGISNAVAVFALYFLLQMGVDTSGGGSLEGGLMPFQNFGAYLAYTLILIYIGRQYYWRTAKQALTFKPQPETDTVAAWGLRVFLVCTVAMVVLLVVAGQIPWHVAMFGIVMGMMSYLVLARLNAEAGTFFCVPSWSLSMILLAFYGFGALGPSAYLGITLVMWMMQYGQFECLMPFAVNGLKAATDTGLKTGRVGLAMGATVIVAMVVTVLVGLWSDYQNVAVTKGARDSIGMYSLAERNIMKLRLAGELDASKDYTVWQRLTHIEPDRRFATWTAVGFVLVFALSTARLRWAWWPLHPVIMLTFGASLMVGKYGASLLLGWFIKAFVIRLAGPTTYMEIRPLMIGVIVGDILGGFITMVSLSGYYFVTGMQGPAWQFW
jgi:hypothetical protein